MIFTLSGTLSNEPRQLAFALLSYIIVYSFCLKRQVSNAGIYDPSPQLPFKLIERGTRATCDHYSPGQASGYSRLPREEYERLGQMQAYLEMLRLSRALLGSQVAAEHLFQTSSDELEARR